LAAPRELPDALQRFIPADRVDEGAEHADLGSGWRCGHGLVWGRMGGFGWAAVGDSRGSMCRLGCVVMMVHSTAAVCG
jgi:hypothetical protein